MASSPVRVFVDANVLFSASYKQEHPFLLFWASKKTEMLTSQYAADEARRNIRDANHLDRLNHLLSRTELAGEIEKRGHRKISLPGKDLPILSGALNSGSRFLVTGDKRHFGLYFNQIFEVHYGIFTIIEPSALLQLLENEE